ncbi:hypothetical protein I553_2962 [Mycobacterium xenopi 4042]|uniref:Uncharacterized protein n=1 Tax=Mycobacterium xenopi 4042 TaxID=1299334 RepID=X8EEQ1_MYCXE|nr:hypothetical protein I553_2962 [Mycobacterium xenopi 4042]
MPTRSRQRSGSRIGEEVPVSAAVSLTPDVGPAWLRPLVDNVGRVPDAYRRRLPADVLALVTAAKATANLRGDGRDAAVLVLFSGRSRHRWTALFPTRPICC